MGAPQARRQASRPLRKMHAVRSDPAGKDGVRTDQQKQSPPATKPEQAPGKVHTVGRAKVPVDDGRARRQATRCGDRIGRPGRIGEKQQGRQGGAAIAPLERARRGA